MAEKFADIFKEGGKKNTLGRAEEVLQIVANDHSHLDELYQCLFDDDAWVRMRAVDTLEKVCRVHPDWLEPYVERLLNEVAAIDQASIQWHLAELFTEINLSPDQRDRATKIMKRNISSKDVDWIVASNTMGALAKFVADNILPASELIPLLKIQQTHHSKAVVKRATRLLDEVGG